MIVTVTGDIDCATGPAIEARLIRALSEDGADVVADLAGVSFVDCAGLGSLVAVQRWAAAHGLRFRIARPAPAVTRLLSEVDQPAVELLPPAKTETPETGTRAAAAGPARVTGAPAL